MNQPTQTEQTHEIINEPQGFDPHALEMVASMGDTLHFSIEDIGDEQCVVARVNDLIPEVRETFDGYGKSDDPDVVNSWKETQHNLELMNGVGNTVIEKVYTGKTGRQKEVQVAFFGPRGLSNAADLMQAVAELNDIRREAGVEAQEGLPDNIAHLPDNILIATKEMRTNSVEELQRINQAQQVALKAGAAAVGGVLTNDSVSAE